MKTPIYLKLVMVFSLIMMLTTLSYAYDPGAVTFEEKTALYNSVDNYYLTFGAENMDDYLGTQYLNHLSSEELNAKKNLIQEMWDEYASGYSLSDKDDCTYIVNDSVAFVEYTLSTHLLDNDYNELNSHDINMTAILFNTKNGWKIFNTVPTSVFEFNTAVDLFNDKEDDIGEEDLIPENLSKNLSKNSSEEFSKTAVDIFRTPENLTCDIDLNLSINKTYSLKDFSSVDLLIGNDKFIKVIIGDDVEIYYHYLNGNITSVPFSDNIDFTVIMDTCTLQRLTQGANPQLEYEKGNIKLKGEKIGSTFKTALGKMFFKVYSWFTPAQPLELWIEAETAELENKGKYSFVGATSRGPGELYLGDKGSFAKYKFNLKESTVVYLYARINDDGLHKDGSRNVNFKVDDSEVEYEHKSYNYEINGNFWGWVYIGEFNLSSGDHTLVISKVAQTSAAFVADKFVFFDKKRDISSFS